MKDRERLFFILVDLGFFSIDANGKIWRLMTNYRKHLQILKPKRPANNSKSKDGYLIINHYYKGKHYTQKVHRLIWLYFKGDIPDNMEINHINGVKTDNRIENLEVVSHGDNMRHARRIIRTWKIRRGEENGMAKLKENDIFEIRKRYKHGELRSELAKNYHVNWSAIDSVVKNRTWTHI